MMDTILPSYARAGASIGEPDESGWRVVTLPVASVRWAAHELLRFGPEAEVLGPPDLRPRMAEIVASLEVVYGTGPRDDGSDSACREDSRSGPTR